MLISAKRAKRRADKKKIQKQLKRVISTINGTISNGYDSITIYEILCSQNKEKIKSKGYKIEEYQEVTTISWEE